MRPGKHHNKTGGFAADHLRSYIERVERLEEEKTAIANDIKEVYAQAKGNGFDTKTMRQIIRLRKMSHEERQEHEALIDIYKAALGMLDGTPLGEAAIRRLSPEEETTEDTSTQSASQRNAPDAEVLTEEKPPEPTVEDAREMARKAAKEGLPVTSNPFPARDPRRAAWDEEWCKSTGTDGMELPEAWRRASKRTKEEDEEDSEGKAA
jgi:uncharacterized protein (UPF0335 family)